VKVRARLLHKVGAVVVVVVDEGRKEEREKGGRSLCLKRKEDFV